MSSVCFCCWEGQGARESEEAGAPAAHLPKIEHSQVLYRNRIIYSSKHGYDTRVILDKLDNSSNLALS